jgi:hypothetical protein
MLELYQTPLYQVPIPNISLEKQQPFIKQVDEFLNFVNKKIIKINKKSSRNFPGLKAK